MYNSTFFFLEGTKKSGRDNLKLVMPNSEPAHTKTNADVKQHVIKSDGAKSDGTNGQTSNGTPQKQTAR